MKDIEIKINSNSLMNFKTTETIGISSENLQRKLIVKIEPFVNGVCRMYIKDKGSILLSKVGNTYELDILSSLLTESTLDVCFKVTQTANEKGTPIFVSKIMTFEVLDTINSNETIPSQYPTWIETFDSKIAELNALEETNQEAVENIIDMTSAYNTNAANKTSEFNANAKTKTDEMEEIAEGVKNIGTAIQFPTFSVNDDLEVVATTTTDLQNLSFDIDEDGNFIERIVIA